MLLILVGLLLAGQIFSFNSFWDATSQPLAAACGDPRTLSIPFGMLLENRAKPTILSVGLSIPFGMLHFEFDLFCLNEVFFQFLLGCYYTCKQRLAGYPGGFQFLLGCYFLCGCRASLAAYLSIPFGMLLEERLDRLEREVHFQFLLGCYCWGGCTGPTAWILLSIPFGMLQTWGLHL